MNSDFFDLAVTIVVMLVLFAFFSVVGFAWNSYACSARWSASGVKAEYRLGAGCTVQRKDGSWLPERALRDVTL